MVDQEPLNQTSTRQRRFLRRTSTSGHSLRHVTGRKAKLSLRAISFDSAQKRLGQPKQVVDDLRRRQVCQETRTKRIRQVSEQAKLRLGNRKADGNRPVHDLATAHVITTQAEDTVILGVGASQKVVMSVTDEPVADMDDPQSGNREIKKQSIEPRIIVDFALLQIKAIAFPVSKRWLNPIPFTPTPPCLTIGFHIQHPKTGRWLVW